MVSNVRLYLDICPVLLMTYLLGAGHPGEDDIGGLVLVSGRDLPNFETEIC